MGQPSLDYGGGWMSNGTGRRASAFQGREYVRLVCIGDTHNRHRFVEMPRGDVLVHCGDFTMAHVNDIVDFSDWLSTLSYKHIIVIAGNHEPIFESRPSIAERLLTNCIYLRDRVVTIGGLRFYGTPWQPMFNDWAFNRSEPQLERLYQKIPDDTDVLITHCPPHGTLDTVPDDGHVGSPALRERVGETRPRYHVFGHIHAHGGKTIERDGTTYVNASVVNEEYELAFKPVVVDI